MDAVIVVLIFTVLLCLIFLVARPGFRRGRPGSSAMVDASPARDAEADDGDDDGDGDGDA
jgi:hypothetical protein